MNLFDRLLLYPDRDGRRCAGAALKNDDAIAHAAHCELAWTSTRGKVELAALAEDLALYAADPDSDRATAADTNYEILLGRAEMLRNAEFGSFVKQKCRTTKAARTV